MTRQLHRSWLSWESDRYDAVCTVSKMTVTSIYCHIRPYSGVIIPDVQPEPPSSILLSLEAE